MAQTTWADVKAILDGLIAGWRAKNNAEPNLAQHGSTFGWDTKEKLAAAKAFGKRLIDPSLVNNGKAKQTNLYLALTTGVGSFSRMPNGGPYISDDDLNKIVEW